MRIPRFALIMSLATALIAGPATATSLAGAAPPTAAPSVPQLVAVRAASHDGYDRVVWEFEGGLPAHRSIRYVDRFVGGASDLPIRIAGEAVLQVDMYEANGHDPDTYTETSPARLVAGLPNVIEVVRSEDFEAHVGYGVGLAKRQNYTVFTLRNPSRVVLDIRKDYTQATRKVTFLDQPRFNAGKEPYTRTVNRVVPAYTPASAVMHQLFAGPTPAERALGLRTVRSRATDFDRLRISPWGVAHIRLLGGCDSGGSTFTVADLITPTLKQFTSVDYVKIYDRSGNTGSPSGPTDSIPECLEP